MVANKPRKKERIRGKVQVGIKPDGTPLYKWVSAQSKRELEQKKEEVTKRYIPGYDAGKLTLGEYVNGWLPGRVAGLAPSTVATIVSRWNVCIAPTLGARYIRSITRGELLELLNVERVKGRCQGHLDGVARLIKEIFSAAQAAGILQINPAYGLKAPTSSSRPLVRRPLTDAETAATLAAIATHPNGLFLAALYYLGLRRGEALGLRWEDFDFAHHCVRVERDIDYADGGTPGEVKSETSRRVIPIPQAAEACFKAAFGFGIGWVFAEEDGRPWRLAHYKSVWCSLMTALASQSDEIEQDRGRAVLTAHYYRHNYATLLHRAGVSPEQARDWLGHSSIAVTMDIYTHLDERERAAAQDALEGVF